MIEYDSTNTEHIDNKKYIYDCYGNLLQIRHENGFTEYFLDPIFRKGSSYNEQLIRN